MRQANQALAVERLSGFCLLARREVLGRRGMGSCPRRRGTGGPSAPLTPSGQIAERRAEAARGACGTGPPCWRRRLGVRGQDLL
jgi:hypothetical protein